jgi:acyl-CoA synthetase (AMP-forming)/AMP-acid ligase II
MFRNPIAVTPSAYGYPLLIKQLLLTPFATAADQEIVYRDRLRYRYRDFRERIARLASALAGLGLKPGMTVAVMDWDSHRYLEAYFAVPMMGAVLMTVNIRLAPEQILYCLNHSRSDLLLVHADFLPVLDAIRDRLETVRSVVFIADGAETKAGPTHAGEYEDLLGQAVAEYEFPDFDENTRATTFYTTGTTGLPKAVYFSHRQLVIHTLAVGVTSGSKPGGQSFNRGDVYMPLTPMFHVHAWGLPFLATLYGVKQVYPGRYQPDVILKLLAAERVTFSHCVPTILQMILNAPEAVATDLSRWKVVVGGSALPLGLARQARSRGIDIWVGYGMSETCPILTHSQLKPWAPPLESEAELETLSRAGLPVTLVDLKIVDAEMRELPADGKTVGEIVVRAPWLTQGYLNDPESSEALWRGGYLHTQDVASQDPAGYVRITDRIKDVIKTGGEWISSLELESLISQHPAVAEVAVIGIKDARWGERPLALVVARPGEEGKLTGELLQRHVAAFCERGLLSRYAVPERFLLVSAIEKTSVGKLDKKLLRQKYGDA